MTRSVLGSGTSRQHQHRGSCPDAFVASESRVTTDISRFQTEHQAANLPVLLVAQFAVLDRGWQIGGLFWSADFLPWSCVWQAVLTFNRTTLLSVIAFQIAIIAFLLVKIVFSLVRMVIKDICNNILTSRNVSSRYLQL